MGEHATAGSTAMKTKLKRGIQGFVTQLIGVECVEKLKFYRIHRCFPDLKSPKTFNEKIVWRKLYDCDPLLPQYVDKYEVKRIVASLVGDHVIIPTLAVYDRLGDVRLDWPLPFVVKWTHASAANVFIHCEQDKQHAIERLRRFAGYDHAFRTNEWAYHVKPRIIVEPMLLIDGRKPNDFKFQVFGGKVYAVQVDTDRYTPQHRRIYYTPDWEMMDFRLTLPRSDPIPRPCKLNEMIRIAETIGQQFTYARVDLYEGPRFGEVTFYPGSGYEKFIPKEWDRRFGDQWTLPTKNLRQPSHVITASHH